MNVTAANTPEAQAAMQRFLARQQSVNPFAIQDSERVSVETGPAAVAYFRALAAPHGGTRAQRLARHAELDRLYDALERERRAAAAPAPAPVVVEQPRIFAERTPYPQVAQGYYAIASLTGNNDLDFFRVDRPTEGKWAGRTFVKRVIGGKADSPVWGSTARAALGAIIAAGERSAAQRYGQEIGRCGRCNRHLTDETSRAYGLGPDCRNK